MPPMNILIKPASGLCNLQCDYCFYCDESAKRAQASYGFMSEETLRNIIRKTIGHAEGSITYAFQGGEPTLCGIPFFKKAMELQKQYNRNHIEVRNTLQTNGYLIDEAWCEFLKENHFLVGLSVDGVEETHDCFRHTKEGKPTYQRIEQAAEQMDAYGIDYNILTVVHKKVAHRIEEIYRDYRRHRWEYQQYIACLEPLGEGHGKTAYGLTPKEYGEFLIRLFDLWYEDWEKGRAPHIRRLENYFQILTGTVPESCEQMGHCGSQIVAEADGSAYPCDFYALDAYCLGNFNTDRLGDLELERKRIGFQERSRNISDKCRECKFYFICRSGCHRNREYHAEAGGYENYFCEGYRMFFEKRLEIMDRMVR